MTLHGLPNVKRTTNWHREQREDKKDHSKQSVIIHRRFAFKSVLQNYFFQFGFIMHTEAMKEMRLRD
jgi:hypothetical protein